MSQPKVIDREQEITFTNFTDEDFEGQWNFAKTRKIYRLRAHKSYYLPFYLAEHFAQHLVQRELNREVENERPKWSKLDQKERERRESAILNNPNTRQELMDKCVQLTDPAELDHMQVREVNVREAPLRTNQRSAEMVREGKISSDVLGPTNKPKTAEDEFEGANIPE